MLHNWKAVSEIIVSRSKYLPFFIGFNAVDLSSEFGIENDLYHKINKFCHLIQICIYAFYVFG